MAGILGGIEGGFFIAVRVGSGGRVACLNVG